MTRPHEGAVLLRRLHPDPATLTPAEVVDGLDLAARAPADRPYVVLNMVATADGRATVAGRTAPISSLADRRLFHALRASVDAVMVGAGTARVERYGRIVRDPELREQRTARGLAADPLAILVSASLRLPADLPLLQDADSRVAIITASAGEVAGCAAQVSYLRPPPGQALDLAEMLGRVRTELGVRSILCEGGPLLNASLLPAGLIDELYLSIAPALAGGAGALTILGDVALAQPIDLELLWLLEAEGELFARYAVCSEHTPLSPGPSPP
ncbi:MAG: dihydrofolate reductase family protein [Solirubrobacterales bacterium]|nr:dihydrofolate reductase family protein [Solirubrobacterales bacterium]